MSSLIQDFMNGAQRVTARIYYFIPLKEGQAPLQVDNRLIGEKARQVPHTNILQTYIFQTEDKTDLKDKRLAKIFEDLVVSRNGIIKIQDRTAATLTLSADEKVAPLLIPRPAELASGGMTDTVEAFKAMIPFPRVRKFLQFWQDNLDGPLHEVQLMAGSIAKSDTRAVAAEYTLN